MSLTISRPEPLSRDVGVDLCGRERRVPQHLLHHPQVGASLKQMCRRRVTETVRTEVGSPGHVNQPTVHESADSTLVDSPSPGPDEERGPAPRLSEFSSTRAEPMGQRPSGWRTERNHALLAAFAEHPHDASLLIEVVDVKTDKLPHPDTAGIEELEDGRVANSNRSAVYGDTRRIIEQLPGLLGGQRLGK